MPRWWTCLAVAVFAGPAAASDVLKHVPREAGFVLVVEKPRQLVEAVRNTDAAQSEIGRAHV